MSVFKTVAVMTIAAILTGCGDNSVSNEKNVSAEMAAQSLCHDAADVIVSDAWIRSSRAGQPTSAAYLTLTNCSDVDDALIGASYPGADAIELHATAMSSGGVASMTQEKTIAIGAGDTISLKPGAGHIMLIGLEGAVTVGAEPALKLKFEKAKTLNVTFEVRDAAHSENHSGH